MERSLLADWKNVKSALDQGNWQDWPNDEQEVMIAAAKRLDRYFNQVHKKSREEKKWLREVENTTRV